MKLLILNYSIYVLDIANWYSKSKYTVRIHMKNRAVVVIKIHLQTGQIC